MLSPLIALRLTVVPSAFTHDELITVNLEGCLETFIVSKALLCKASDYFIKALDENFVEGQSRTLKLPGCSVDTFRVFLYYAINQNLPRMRVTSRDQFATLDAALWHRMKNLMVRASVFADFILMPEFAAEATNCLLTMIDDTYIHVATVELIYELSPEGSWLRDIAVKEAMWTNRCVGYGREEMDRFSALPGFFYEFADDHRQYPNLAGEEASFPHAGIDGWTYDISEKPDVAI